MRLPVQFRRGLQCLILVFISVLLISCETVSYYSQAARGQIAILTARQNIERLLADETLDSDLRATLELTLAIRQFAEQELALPAGDNYSTYVDLEREYVVWNVFAAPEFSIDPVNWCYPVAGCVSYRGYFSEQQAIRFAQQLEAEGYDVYTGGVDAYSTLGWFEDSLLSTILDRSPYQLAGLIFHELAHQVAYVPDDTTFNESLATAVEREGLRRWFAYQGDAAAQAQADASIRQQQQFIELVTRCREQFEALYHSDLDIEQMRKSKAALQLEMRATFEVLKLSWGGYTGYDSWFSRSLNNAQLSTVGSYNDLVPAFNEMLIKADGDLTAFYEAVKSLAQLDFDERRAALQNQ